MPEAGRAVGAGACYAAAVRSDGRARRDAILDAALACFGEHGVVSTGIEDIRKRAEASPSSVYHLFGSLEGILLALLVRTFARLFGELAARVTKTRTAEAAVKALVRGQLDWVFAHPLEARVMYEAMTLASAPELAAEKAKLLAPVVAHLQRFIDEGALPRWSPLLFDVVLLGATHEAARRYLAGAPLEPAWMKRELPRLAWASLPRKR